MEKFDIYKDIAKRTNGDIYLGVVGPVRSGKSTFVTKFIDLIVSPNIISKAKRQIAIDEMPQSGSGNVITTTEPKFVPSEAVKISLKGKTTANVRIIDCVGYMVDGASGGKDGDKERLFTNPWTDKPMPLEKVAEIGTRKVIKEHSTIAVVVTTDGSICDIPRENYLKAEEKAILELLATKKPFVILVNSSAPSSKECKSVAESLTNKYGVNAMPINLLETNIDELSYVLESVLKEFPIKSLDVKLPKWMQVLPKESNIITALLNTVKEVTPSLEKMKHSYLLKEALESVNGIKRVSGVIERCGDGKIVYELEPSGEIFYDLITELAGEKVADEKELMSYIKELNVAKENYRKLKEGLLEVEQNGYGIVIPKQSEMTIEDPVVVKQGGRYGVKIKAKTSCMHLLKIDLDADVTPISGTEKQCKDFAEILKEDYKNDPQKVFNTNVFGKPLSSIVLDEIVNKIDAMKDNTKNKMVKTVTRIVNEGRGGVICILL